MSESGFAGLEDIQDEGKLSESGFGGLEDIQDWGKTFKELTDDVG